jgi:uncharacterized protein YkwD
MGRRAGAIATALTLTALTLHWHTTRLDAAATVSPLDRELVSWLNNERQWNGIRRIPIDGDLAAQAQLQAQRMAHEQRLYHTPQGEMYWWMARGWDDGVGENVGVTNGQGILALYGIHLGFVASPGHRAIMLDPDYDGVGVAVSQSADGRLWYAQFYGGV